MKKLIALLFALLSGFYLLVMGITPDPLPFIDEATALLILGGSLRALGFDLSRFLPFLGRRKASTRVKNDGKGPVIDI